MNKKQSDGDIRTKNALKRIHRMICENIDPDATFRKVRFDRLNKKQE